MTTYTVQVSSLGQVFIGRSDGPDTLTIVVTNVGTTAQSVLGRISWTEAQA